MAIHNNRTTRTRAAQTSKAAPATIAEIKTLIEQSKQAPPVPAAKVPMVASIIYVFENGEVSKGTPATMRLVQNVDAIELLNVISTDGDKMTYNAVATFRGMQMQKVEIKGSCAGTPPAAKV